MITTDMDANSSAAAPLPQDVTQTINAALDMAQQHLRDDELDVAAQLFLAVLELAPQEPFANRQLGLLSMRVGDAAAAVPYFAVVLAAQPEQSTSWLDYIEALILSGQHETAQQMLALGRQHGLDSLDTDRLQQALTLRMNGIPDATATQPVPQETPAESDQPVNARMNVLFNQQRYPELEREARALTRRKANDGVAWKMLGLALLMQGPSALRCHVYKRPSGYCHAMWKCRTTWDWFCRNWGGWARLSSAIAVRSP